MKFKALILTLLLATPCLAQCKKTRIAVIDTGLDLMDPRFTAHLCKKGHKNFVTGESLEDTVGHGTHVTGLIEKYAGNSNYCLVIYKYYSETASGDLNLKREVSAFKQAIKDKVDLVNFSGGGSGFNQEEAALILKNPRITFVVAAGNDGVNLDISGYEYWPASLFYKNMEVVEALGINGNRLSSSNYSKRIKDKELGENVLSFLPNGKSGYLSGSSMATAIFSGKLLDKLSNSCNNR